MRLSEIAALVGGTMVGDRDPEISAAAGLDQAGPGDVTFVARKALAVKLAGCRAAAVIAGPDVACDLPLIQVSDPYGAFAKVLAEFAPDLERSFPVGRHETAVIDTTAAVAAKSIGPYCVVGAGAKIGAGTVLGPHVVIEADVVIGEDCVIYPQTTIRERCVLGDRVIVQSGAVIGTDGFGYLPAQNGLRKIPQIGIVVIADDVEIGANVCIDRATTGETVIGRGSKLDNLVQIGHNVQLGEHCTLSSQTGVSGSCRVGNRVQMGGQVGLSDHVNVADDAKIAAKSGVYKDIAAGQTVFGYPAVERSEAWRIVSAQRKLPDLLRTVGRLERSLARDDSEEDN